MRKINRRHLLITVIVTGIALPLVVFSLLQNTNHTSSAQVADPTPTPIPGYNQIQPPVLSSSAPVAVTTCPGQATSNTNYILNQDIVHNITTQACFDLSNVNGVSIDCQGHQIIPQPSNGVPASIDVQQSSNFSIKNCTVNQIYVLDSSKGLIDKNVSVIGVSGSTPGGANNIMVTNNTGGGGGVDDSHVEFSKNTVQVDSTVRSVSGSGVIELHGGTNNNIINNTIDGAWNGDPNSQLGADDGIMLISESNDYISGNIIKNAWDCGIETIGQQTSQKIINNTISNIGYCGIGSFYQTSWNNNLVQGNTVSQARMLFQLYLLTNNFSQYAPSAYYFQDNQFINNQFLSGTPSNTNSANMNFDSRYLPAGVTVTTGNDSFKDNDFGTFDTGPNFLPQSMVVDLGGNKCSPTPSLSCINSTPTPTTALLTLTPTPTPSPTVTPTPTPTLTPTPTPVDAQSPTVVFTYPTNGGSVPRNRTITLAVSASDNVGVTRVEIYVNNVLQCTDSSSPYTCSWVVPSRKGTTYSLSAKAYDAAGNVGTTSITVKAQ